VQFDAEDCDAFAARAMAEEKLRHEEAEARARQIALREAQRRNDTQNDHQGVMDSALREAEEKQLQADLRATSSARGAGGEVNVLTL
jgi:hypothetical protein